MKQILVLYTGGTICSAPHGDQRALDPRVAARALLADFAASDSPYAREAGDLFADSGYDPAWQTLSENMTLYKWAYLLAHLGKVDPAKYAGIILLHGTDTLAYTAALLSFWMAGYPLPICLVSGQGPPMMEGSNAGSNFRAAAELILAGLAPGVYVPYRNADGKMWLHKGSRLLQCPSYSEDFSSAGDPLPVTFASPDHPETVAAARAWATGGTFAPPAHLYGGKQGRLLYIQPHPGLDYAAFDLSNVAALLHGAYHSGTVCTDVGAAGPGSASILWLADACRERGIPLLIAPACVHQGQYESTGHLAAHPWPRLLPMTAEAAWGKALTGLSHGFTGETLVSFMERELAGEMVGL